MTINEVAPPGYGHTKGDKKKGVEKGGTAAAFDRARKEGRFKGSKSDMFAIMWSQKNKGDKPHYKPGTNKKYKKYQDESFEIDKSAHKMVQKKAKIGNLEVQVSEYQQIVKELTEKLQAYDQKMGSVFVKSNTDRNN